MDDFSVAKHQPHPPGYVFLVYAGKLLKYLVKDANLALILVNIILSCLACVLVFSFAYNFAPQHKTAIAWGAWLLFIPNVLFWFYGSVSDIYAAELFGSLLVAYCCYRSISGSKIFFYLAPIALALLGSIKLTTMVFLLPLAFYTLLKSPFKNKVQAVLIFLLFFSAWFVPLVISDGMNQYFGTVLETFLISKKNSMVRETGFVRAIIRNLRDLIYYVAIAAGVFNVGAILLLLITRHKRYKTDRKEATFFVLWLAPYTLFIAFVYLGNIGYLLPFVPFFALLISKYYSNTVSRNFAVALIFISFVISTSYFLFMPRLSPDAIGEGLNFGQKTWKQRVLAQVNLFTFPVLQTLRRQDQDMEQIVEAVNSICPPGESPALITTDAQFGNWRKLQYYFPNSIVVRLYEQDKNPFMIAHARKFTVHEEKTLVVTEVCKTFWFFNPVDVRTQVLEKTAGPRLVFDNPAKLYVTQGDVDLTYGDEVTLQIR